MPAVTDAVPALVERVYGLTICAKNDETRSVDVIASSESLDSYDEIVQQDWNLARYLANPVVLWNHNRGTLFSSDPSATLPIGTASNVKVEDGRLTARLTFVDAKANPMAAMIWEGFKQGSLRAVSVGFRPKNIRQEMRDGKEIYVLGANELHEISVVPIPANPDAVARAKAMDQLRALSASTTAAKGGMEPIMNILVSLAAILGLAPTASEAEVTDAVRSMHGRAQTVAKLEGELTKAATSQRALEAQTDRLTEERESALKRAEKAEAQVLEGEVDALVGKKITPAEKDGFIELARTNRALFAKMVEQRADLKLTTPVIPESRKAATGQPVTGIEDLADIDAELQKLAG